MAGLTSNSDRNRAKITIIATTLILLIGLVLALVAMQSQTILFNNASTDDGVAEISLSPSSSNIDQGETFTVDVMIDTQGKVISGVSVLVNYVSGDGHPLKIVEVKKSPNLEGEEWIFPVLKPGRDGSAEPDELQIAALYVSPNGYAATAPFSLATITFEGQSEGDVKLNFDVTETKITEKSTAQDVLLTPTTQGSYSVGSGGTNPTPTTGPTATPTQSESGSSVDLEKSSNGYDADQSPGPRLTVGDSVTWRYKVTNTGTTELTDIVVTDDREGTISCPLETLGAGQDMTCTKYGTVGSGQYSNTATVRANTEDGVQVSDSDLSHYFGEGAETSPTPTSAPTPTISSLPQAGNETPLVIAGGIGLVLILAAGAVLLL